MVSNFTKTFSIVQPSSFYWCSTFLHNWEAHLFLFIFFHDTSNVCNGNNKIIWYTFNLAKKEVRGNIKDDFFKSFMPNNLGISKCNTSKCPWKNRRQFNENVLSTNKNNNFLNCIPSIVNKNINSPLLNIDDFKNVSYNIISQSIYGDINHNEILKKFTEEVESENIMSTDFYKEYKKDLHNSYNNSYT